MSKKGYQVILLAAGTGKRMNAGMNKQFLKIGNEEMILHTIKLFEQDEWCQHIYLVIHKEDEKKMHSLLSNDHYRKIKKIVHGGKERQHSVYNGIQALDDELITFVHDGARPFVTKDELHELYLKAEKNGAAFLAVPVVDTIKHVEDDRIKTLDRAKLVAAQTPQAFKYHLLKQVHTIAYEKGIVATDDVSLLELINHVPAIVAGSDRNFKVTTPDDIQKAENMLQINRQHNREGQSLFRIGQGFDVHELVDGRPCIIGGVTIPYEKGLAGHSDADVLLHTITDAALGAIGQGDIGTHFPDTDPAYKDADSKVLLQRIWKMVIEAGYTLNNLDCTIMAQAPKMAPYIDDMKQSVANLLQVDSSLINIKATTTEKLGFVGRKEGIAAQAVILLRKIDAS